MCKLQKYSENGLFVDKERGSNNDDSVARLYNVQSLVFGHEYNALKNQRLELAPSN